MTYPISNPGAGARISATVKWYNPAKAYGFLVPADGSPDIYCRDSALAAVGLDTLLAGATVRATASVVLSWRIERATPPRKAKALT